MSRRRFKRAKRRRRRRSLSASVWGPILKLLAVILVFLALLYAIFYVVIPKAADFMGWDYRPPFALFGYGGRIMLCALCNAIHLFHFA